MIASAPGAIPNARWGALEAPFLENIDVCRTAAPGATIEADGLAPRAGAISHAEPVLSIDHWLRPLEPSELKGLAPNQAASTKKDKSEASKGRNTIGLPQLSLPTRLSSGGGLDVLAPLFPW
jgi:hypothetical protein